MKIKLNQEVLEHGLDQLKDNPENYIGVYGCDLHHNLYNLDYFVIGYYNAEKFLERSGGIFKCIHQVKNYELDMFGECNTDLSNSEQVANILAYIEGELVLFECETLKEYWDIKLDEEGVNKIINELENL